jgi:hypothetical protein
VPEVDDDGRFLMSCPFYGNSHFALAAHGVLMTQHGNECALITGAFSPCRMEVGGVAPHWPSCPLNKLWTSASAAVPPLAIEGCLEAPLIEPLDPDVRPPDEIEVKPGVVHLPKQFYQVAKAANAAGLAGFEVYDLDFGVDRDAAREELLHPSGDEGFNLPCRIKLSYRRPA